MKTLGNHLLKVEETGQRTLEDKSNVKRKLSFTSNLLNMMSIVNMENQRKIAFRTKNTPQAQGVKNNKIKENNPLTNTNSKKNLSKTSIEKSLRKGGISLLDFSNDSPLIDSKDHHQSNESFSSRETWIKHEKIKFKGERVRISTSTDFFQFDRQQTLKNFFQVTDSTKVI